MHTDSFLLQILAQLVTQVPVLLVSVAGIIAVAARRPAGAAWAVAGFALAGVLCIAVPVVQSLVVRWAAASGVRAVDTASTFAVMGLVWSVLRAASLGLLLTAVLTPRPGAPEPPR